MIQGSRGCEEEDVVMEVEDVVMGEGGVGVGVEEDDDEFVEPSGMVMVDSSYG